MLVIRDIPLSLNTMEVNSGVSGVPLTERWHLLALVNVDEIGVKLTTLRVPVPCKSTSKVMGMGPRMPRRT